MALEGPEIYKNPTRRHSNELLGQYGVHFVLLCAPLRATFLSNTTNAEDDSTELSLIHLFFAETSIRGRTGVALLEAKFSTRTGFPKVLYLRAGASESDELVAFWLLGSVRERRLDGAGLGLLEDDFFGTGSLGPKTEASIWESDRFRLLFGISSFELSKSFCCANATTSASQLLTWAKVSLRPSPSRASSGGARFRRGASGVVPGCPEAWPCARLSRGPSSRCRLFCIRVGTRSLLPVSVQILSSGVQFLKRWEKEHTLRFFQSCGPPARPAEEATFLRNPPTHLSFTRQAALGLLHLRPPPRKVHIRRFVLGTGLHLALALEVPLLRSRPSSSLGRLFGKVDVSVFVLGIQIDSPLEEQIVGGLDALALGGRLLHELSPAFGVDLHRAFALQTALASPTWNRNNCNISMETTTTT
jgi:hypothetical protein